MRRLFVALSLLLLLTTVLPSSQGEPEEQPQVSEEWVALESLSAEDLAHIDQGFMQLGFCVSAEDCGNWIRQCIAGAVQPCNIGAVCLSFVVTGPLVPSPQQVASGSAGMIGKAFRLVLSTSPMVNFSGGVGQGQYGYSIDVAGQRGC